MNNLPKTVARILNNFDAWLVGSAVTEPNPRDYDILVPFSEWHRVCVCIPKDAKPNSFAGWKFFVEEENIEIDIWPGDMQWFIHDDRVETVYHHKTRTLLRKEKSEDGP